MFEHDVKNAYHRVQSVHVHVGGGGTWCFYDSYDFMIIASFAPGYMYHVILGSPYVKLATLLYEY